MPRFSCLLLALAACTRSPSPAPAPAPSAPDPAQVAEAADGRLLARKLPRIAYRGGPFLRHPRIVTITFSSDDAPKLVARLEQFGGLITRTGWWRAVVDGYCGKDGACSKVELRNTKTGKVSYQPAKFSGLRTEEGDVVTYYSPSGGGYGDPLERDPSKVLDDVLDGFITVDHARADYGVALNAVDDGYGWALDTEATRALRAKMAGS